mmetsp:Transcript_20466/g.43917  ORF Transcript_20466/g.43917 Transcript_20466/m.43917 type:complete len:297 (+) Transcript_20466:142-1032(+)|eukprot:CAMPEP_0172527816 /NCGR_PEP_ID=MMETSP1067-20121228/2391_1 /TAXON_ID=265564 ORGANISM="Thalassiosira punctigera, Strain Tpunct2005C2" /NCGR_SAMPLE_ID=MMETSP1067 /ASSEMBLY_ACC=CAM_ASM_000444 /LENGTH=296 /DNA_ID=CAMNT_0013311625 /DNA_START=80 /DNA_END=970 /DNA_ORIENTATION=-
MANSFTDGVEDVPIEPPLQPKSNYPSCFCCNCSYHVPTIRELYARDKRLLRVILTIVLLLNAPVGKYVLYPCMIFSTWIHESFHGLAALSTGGKISWLNIYPDGSGLAHTIIPIGKFQSCWVSSAGYCGTAVAGGLMLMFRRTNFGARVGTCGLGMAMLLSCLLFVRNSFGLAVLVPMGTLLVFSGWRLPPFWVGELYALLAATTCLNAITSIRVLFFVTEATIGGVVRTSDATAMQNVTKIHSWIWASIWMVLAFWMTALGILITVETKEKGRSREVLEEFRGEDHPLALSTELA